MPTIFDIEKGEFVELSDTKKKGVIELNDSAVALIKGDKGDRGEPGESITGPAGADGRDGVDGDPGKDAVGIPGKDGKDGSPGAPGKDAPPAKDGRGIASVTQTDPGKALITYTDGKTQAIILPAGMDGREVEMGKSATHIQWRYKGETKWRDLMLIPKARTGGGGGGGVSAENLDDILVAGSNITITKSGENVTIASTAGGGGTWGSITGTLANQTDLQTALDAKVDENGAITGATKTKITYDTKGLVTAGADATTADITASTDKNYVTDAQAVVIGNTSGTNSGNQTSIVGITGTKAQFDTAVTDGNILYVGDITQYTDEAAQDAIGAMVDTTLVYTDGTPLLVRAALTGDVTASAGSNATALATVNANVGSFTNTNLTVNAKGLITAASNGSAGGTPVDITVANEATDSSCFPLFVTAATGDLGPKTNAGLAFDSSTGMLTVTGVTAPLTGNSSTATALANARTIGGTSFNGTANIVPATITVADTTDATCSVALFESATGDLAPKTDGGLTYAADSGTLTATAFAGPLTGNVTGNASGTAATVTTAAQPSITSLGTLTTLTVDDITINGNTISSAGASTLAITPTAGQTITFDGTVTLDAGVIAGATSITSTVFVGALTGDVTGNVSGTSGSTTGNAATVTVADAAADTTTFPLLGVDLTGSLSPRTDAGLTYNANTNALSTTTFIGALTGLASTATALATPRTIGGVNFDGTANIVPDTITSINEATDTSCFPLFITASGTQSVQPKNNTALTFNSNTGALGATTFVGTLTTAAQPNITSVSTLTGGATGAGFTVAFGSSTLTGQVPMANGGTGANLVDPNADRFLFWDDSAGAMAFLTPGNGVTITTTTVAIDSASDTVDGIVELATIAETTTGTDATRAVTPDGLAGSDYGKRIVGVLVSDPGGSAITTGDGKACFEIPAAMNGWNLVTVTGGVSTVSSSGIPTVQLRRSRRASSTTRTDADMLSTKLTIDASEFSSVDAAAAAVIDAANDDVNTGDVIYIDIDVAGTACKGLMITLSFQLP